MAKAKFQKSVAKRKGAKGKKQRAKRASETQKQTAPEAKTRMRMTTKQSAQPATPIKRDLKTSPREELDAVCDDGVAPAVPGAPGSWSTGASAKKGKAAAPAKLNFKHN